jgi:hypothetical protein
VLSIALVHDLRRRRRAHGRSFLGDFVLLKNPGNAPKLN